MKVRDATSTESAPSPARTTAQVEPLQIGRFQIKLVGDSPLICHAWSVKARGMILDKQMKKGRQAKEAKNPEQDYLDSLYPHPSGGYGFPVSGIKQSAVSACRFAEGMKMTGVRGAFHIEGEMAKIDGSPQPREDMVRVGMGVADIRFRGEFPEWQIPLTITYNRRAISPDEIVTLFNIAGFGVGLGEWRPEKDGSFGRFHAEAAA